MVERTSRSREVHSIVKKIRKEVSLLSSNTTQTELSEQEQKRFEAAKEKLRVECEVKKRIAYSQMVCDIEQFRKRLAILVMLDPKQYKRVQIHSDGPETELCWILYDNQRCRDVCPTFWVLFTAKGEILTSRKLSIFAGFEVFLMEDILSPLPYNFDCNFLDSYSLSKFFDGLVKIAELHDVHRDVFEGYKSNFNSCYAEYSKTEELWVEKACDPDD